jgi:hypothetical protein
VRELGLRASAFGLWASRRGGFLLSVGSDVLDAESRFLALLGMTRISEDARLCSCAGDLALVGPRPFHLEQPFGKMLAGYLPALNSARFACCC